MNHTTPRQRRLQAEREVRVAILQEAVRMILGGVLLIGIFIVFACL